MLTKKNKALLSGILLVIAILYWGSPILGMNMERDWAPGEITVGSGQKGYANSMEELWKFSDWFPREKRGDGFIAPSMPDLELMPNHLHH